MTFSQRWLWLFALGALPLSMAGFGSVWIAFGALWYCLLVLLALTDWLLFPDPADVQLERIVDDRLALGIENSVELRVRNGAHRALRLEIRDTPPGGMLSHADAATFCLQLAPAARKGMHYQVSPRARGDFQFGDLYLRLAGQLGMVSRITRVDAARPVRVYPNIHEAAKFSLMAQRGRLQQMGIRKARIQGAGREFESLRDYLPDDEMRRIDWKATARRGRLVARQYEVEKSQTVILVVDVGRTMRAEIDGIQKLDYAINAALLLAYVATLADDQVGLLVFADTVQSWIPPRRGRSQVYAILDALYNAQATLAEPDYRGALSYLQQRWRKRSLTVCFTDFWDPDSSRITIDEITRLQPRHLVAAVTLLDSRVQRAAERELTDAPAAFERAVALQVLDDRARAIAALTQRGVLVVDSPAEKLSAELVNRYLEVKARLML